jgi:type I restriction enzyme S subunit
MGKFEKLGDVCDFIGGSQPAKSNFVYDLTDLDKSEYARLIQIRDYKSDKHIVYIPKSSTKKFCKVDDVMIGRYGPPVFQILRGLEGAYNVALMKAVPKSEALNKEYLFYFLMSPSIQNYIVKLSERAAGQTGVNKPALHGFPILVPSIPEQKRIVALLDTAFADLEQTRAKTEQNLKNARELFDSYLQQVFSQKGEGWVETTLGSEINLLTGFAFKSKEYVTHSDSTPLIRGDNIVQGKLRWDDVKRWSNDTASDYEKYQLEADDIVIAMDRTWVKAGMKFSKITSEDLPALLVQRVARLRALDTINSDYLYHLVGSKLFENYVLSIQTGLGVPHISGKQIQAFSFNKPVIEQQTILVLTMNTLKSEVIKLETIYQKKLEAIDELKNSILQKAFSGELTHD